MNNKGFMMAEVVVVSAIILTFLAALYLSYNKLFSAYKTRINYYDSVTLYRLAYYRDALIEADEMNGLINAHNNIKDIFSGSSVSKIDSTDKVYLIYNNQKEINVPSATLNTFNPTFKDYIDYIKSAVKFRNTNYLLIMERCVSTDDCRYAYLEVYDGKET